MEFSSGLWYMNCEDFSLELSWLRGNINSMHGENVSFSPGSRTLNPEVAGITGV
jgi:hypothetical protein